MQVYTDNADKCLRKEFGPCKRQTAHDVLLEGDDRQAAALSLWKAAKP
ncbi:hypothetical protein FCH32_14670 [Citrobacter gillenii]|uniref:Uncharacterized protein n=1 Tax=Citrobacter gillenii TaxID=67828 RepID=A0ABD6M4F9_9ENTR|nr:hypothetical protein [Citrobacter gillenii]